MSSLSKLITHNSKLIILVLVLLFSAGVNYYLSRPDASLPRKSLADFPKELGDWTAVAEGTMDSKVMAILQVDDYIIRNYRNSKGEFVRFYIGYFKSQREGKGIHSPRQCLPGAGWTPTETSAYPLPIGFSNPRSPVLDPHSSSIRVNKYIMGKGGDRQLHLFWYHGRSRVYASEYWNKVYLIWDSLTRKRTDGALIHVDSVVRGDPDKALQTQIAFINLFYPLLKEYIPE